MKVKVLAPELSKAYEGPYDLMSIVEAIGADDGRTHERTIQVEVVASYPEENVAIAKMVNYASEALTEQCGSTSVDYKSLRKRLVDDEKEFSGPWFWEFGNTDYALFFLSAMKNVDIYIRPKWQVWVTPADGYDPEQSKAKIRVFEGRHFVEHYFHKVSKTDVAILTQSAPGSDTAKFLEAVRQRFGKKFNLIGAARASLSPEEKLKRMVEKIPDEERHTAPEAYSKLVSGEISVVDFKLAVKQNRKAKKSTAKTAIKTVVGAQATVRRVSTNVQARIDAANRTVAEKRKIAKK